MKLIPVEFLDLGRQICPVTYSFGLTSLAVPAWQPSSTLPKRVCEYVGSFGVGVLSMFHPSVPLAIVFMVIALVLLVYGLRRVWVLWRDWGRSGRPGQLVLALLVVATSWTAAWVVFWRIVELLE